MALLLPSPSSFLKLPYVFVRSSYGAGLFLSKTNTLLDKAALTYAEALEGQTAGVPQLKTCTMPVSARNDSNMKMGWALKTSGSKFRFTSTQVSYLTSKFKIGEETGQKANPASVARAMRTGKDTNGNPFFTYEYFLTSTQIASFFSRLASKKSLANEDEVVMDDSNSAASETEMEKLTSVAALEAGLTHPITYEVYNLCDMSSKSKLKNLSISQLRDICKSYDILTLMESL